jgi:hypothetical protein
MADSSKHMVIGSMVVAGLVALAAILDMALGIPFAKHMVLDILFLISAAIIGYLAWDAYRDLA